MWDVLSGVAEVAWDVLSGAAKMAWDVLSGVTKTAWDVCPGWQIDAGCFVRGGKKWHGMFCPGMFCPTFAYINSLTGTRKGTPHPSLSDYNSIRCLHIHNSSKPICVYSSICILASR